MEFFCELKKVVDDSYQIQIGKNLENQLVADINGGLLKGKKKLAVVTDEQVKSLYAENICNLLCENGYDARLITIGSGEKFKTRQVKEYVEDTMLGFGFRRDCAVIAVGGGVVTDLAGFVAGTYGRGVDFVNYATTLLSAADASVGGKTAVDTPLATNLIGIFNQPKKVYLDIDTWKTLPKREIYSGLAETIKHACLADAEFFEFLENNIEKIINLDEQACMHVAQKNCEIKYNVVMQDERESGLREILNLGHTVGRAIETVSDYKLLHGEAVSIGLVAQARLGEKHGFISKENVERLENLLAKAHLPIAIPDYINKAELVKKLYTDKKVRNGTLRFVFQKEIGGMMCFGENQYGLEIAEQDIADIINKL